MTVLKYGNWESADAPASYVAHYTDWFLCMYSTIQRKRASGFDPRTIRYTRTGKGIYYNVTYSISKPNGAPLSVLILLKLAKTVRNQ
jgi:hypothetical protein